MDELSRHILSGHACSTRALPREAGIGLTWFVSGHTTTSSRWIFVKHPYSSGELDPGVSATVVDGILRRWKAGVSESADGDGYSTFDTLFGVKQVRSANRTETKPEPCSLITRSHILGGYAGHLVGR